MQRHMIRHSGKALLGLALLLTLLAASSIWSGLSMLRSSYANADPAAQDTLRQIAGMFADFCFLLVVAWLLLAVLAALCLWGPYARRVREPLGKLLKQAKAIRLWRHRGEVECDAPGPIGELANEFNYVLEENSRLREDLKTANTRQDRRVSYRTKRLDKEMRRLRKSASTDPLSGLGNRAHLDKQLPLYVAKAQLEGRELSCLMIDIDNFKALNDTLGHQAGDELIQFIGELLNAATREEDLVCRYGGDEFVLLLPDCACGSAAVVAERIRRMFVCESRRFKVDLGMSIGLACIASSDGSDPEELIKRTDASLYRAKCGGRNQVVAAV